jgi:hypothetical protein
MMPNFILNLIKMDHFIYFEDLGLGVKFNSTNQLAKADLIIKIETSAYDNDM